MWFDNAYHNKCTIDGFSIFFLCLSTTDYKAINALLYMYLLFLYTFRDGLLVGDVWNRVSTANQYLISKWNFRPEIESVQKFTHLSQMECSTFIK